MALAEGREIERLRPLLGKLRLLAPRLRLERRQQRGQRGIIQPGDGHQLVVFIQLAHRFRRETIGSSKSLAAADRPGDRRRVERQGLFDLVQQFERIAALAVELIDEGDDGDVAQPTDFEQFSRARLYALGGVDDHDGGVDRRQRAIGVFRKVLVARRVQQVEDAIAIFEGHHRGDDRNAALALYAHPVGAGLRGVALGADLAGELNCAAKQQQLFGQRGLAGVGMRNNREGAPPGDRIGEL